MVVHGLMMCSRHDVLVNSSSSSSSSSGGAVEARAAHSEIVTRRRRRARRPRLPRRRSRQQVDGRRRLDPHGPLPDRDGRAAAGGRGMYLRTTSLSFQQIPSENAELLGAPLFPGTVLDLTWAKRCDELTRATERLASIGAQDALTLLRASFSSPKVLHLLRCSPSADISLSRLLTAI